ncbi:MAG: SDR family oxidoreductase [Deltaproteobacteria bacterium]|nr:SDR family oxidoreductase [Deltaproteobacteria bacterium]
MSKTYAMTGGATGIGASLKEKLQQRGDRVIVVDIVDAEIIADLSQPEGRREAVLGIHARAPDGLDGFVACAGLGPHIEPKSTIDRVNYFGVVSTIEGVRELVGIKRGSIVAVSSNSAHMDDVDAGHINALLAGDEAGACEWIDKQGDYEAGANAYCGSKRAVALWVRRNAPDYARAGVRLNAIAPGMVDTALNRGAIADEVFRDAMTRNANTIPLGGMGDPDMISDAILFMLDDASRFMAGSVLFVDGAQDAEAYPDTF